MKSIIEYIKESLIQEGGFSIENSSSIRGDLAGKVAEEIIKQFTDKFNKSLKCSPLGSTGKKGKNQFSGDIDIAVEMLWDNKDELIKFVKDNLNISSFGNINNTLHVFNFGYKYNEDNIEKIVQVDIMFVNDIEFAQFAYHSPDFTKNESKYKGMYQSALLMSVIANTPVVDILGQSYKTEFFNDEYDSNYKGEIKSFWKFNLTQADGVKINHKSYEGKTKPVKNPKTIESKKYTTSVSKILKDFLGDNATKESCNSFESLLEYLVSDNYKFRSKEMLESIKEDFMNDWQIKMKTDKSLMDEFEREFNIAIKLIK